jgi:signal transduction histidine kinase
VWWAAVVAASGLAVWHSVLSWHTAPPGVGIRELEVVGPAAELAVGFLFWMWRPGNIVGPLLVIYVACYPLNDLEGFSSSRLPVTLAALFWLLFEVFYIQMLFVFPTGRLWTRRVWPLLACVYVVLLSWGIPDALFQKSPRTYLYLGHGWAGLRLWDTTIWPILLIAAFTAIAVALVIRLWTATPGARRRILPMCAWFVVIVTFDAYYFGIHLIEGESTPTWFNYLFNTGLGPILSAAAALWGLGRVRSARSSVADLVVELGRIEPGRVRDTLARTLGDPSLELGLWLPDRQVWVDEEGRELELPDRDDQRAATYVGNHLAVMVHHPDLLDQPRLLEAVGSAGRLALENERLQAELRAQLHELQTSRARIVRTADEERRRLERDLHDGAQQRLLGLGMGLQLLNRHTDEQGRQLLDDVQGELDEALRELRELARGIHPAVLTDQGLAAAVRTLAQRAAVPVTVTSTDERAPAHVETAAYFVVSEALANVAKYAHATRASVELARDNGDLRVEIADDGIGGASIGAGSGLTGLADRVGALGGALNLDSPAGAGTRLTALIPCGGEAA